MFWRCWIIGALCALWGCGASLGGPVKPWKAELPNAARWQLSAAPGCVLALGAARKGEQAPRFLRCYDPADGARRWARKIPGAADSPRERLLVYGGLVLYQDTSQVRALDAEDGALVWRFDPNGRAITGIALEGDRLLLSLNHDTLAILRAGDGGWVRGLSAPEHRLQGGLRHGSGRDLLVLQAVDGEQRLVALPQDGEGGAAPLPPFPAAKARWSVKLSGAPRAVTQVGALVLVEERGHEALLVRPRDGEVVRRLKLAQPPAQGEASALSGRAEEDRLAATATSSLERAEGFPEGHWLTPEQDGALVLGHGLRQGRWLSLREVSAVDPASWAARWVVALPSGEPLRAVSALPEGRALLLMTGSEGVVVDARTGQRRSRAPLPQGRAGWTDVAVDARGLYVVYGRDPKARLEAWPLEGGANEQPKTP